MTSGDSLQILSVSSLCDFIECMAGWQQNVTSTQNLNEYNARKTRKQHATQTELSVFIPQKCTM